MDKQQLVQVTELKNQSSINIRYVITTSVNYTNLMLPNLCNGVVWSAGSLQTFNSTDTYTNMSRLRNRIIYTFDKTILNSAEYLHITLTIAQSWPQECGLTYRIEDCACINKQKRFASAFRGRNRVTFRGVAWRPRVWACMIWCETTSNIVSFQLRVGLESVW